MSEIFEEEQKKRVREKVVFRYVGDADAVA